MVVQMHHDDIGGYTLLEDDERALLLWDDAFDDEGCEWLKFWATLYGVAAIGIPDDATCVTKEQ